MPLEQHIPMLSRLTPWQAHVGVLLATHWFCVELGYWHRTLFGGLATYSIQDVGVWHR